MQSTAVNAFIKALTPDPAVNTDARRQGFARAAVACYLPR
jgi:hypothetical protein